MGLWKTLTGKTDDDEVDRLGYLMVARALLVLFAVAAACAGVASRVACGAL